MSLTMDTATRIDLTLQGVYGFTLTEAMHHMFRPSPLVGKMHGEPLQDLSHTLP
jgi:hypothetical protein